MRGWVCLRPKILVIIWPSRNGLKATEAVGELAPSGPYFGCKFDYAVDVLAQRQRLLGIDHPYVRAWGRNQHAVFAACRNFGAEVGPGPVIAESESPDIAAIGRAHPQWSHGKQSEGAGAQFWEIAEQASITSLSHQQDCDLRTKKSLMRSWKCCRVLHISVLKFS